MSIGLEFIKVEIKDAVTEIVIIVPGIGHIAGTGIKTITEEGEAIVTEEVIGIIGPITEITVGPETGTVIEMIVGTTIDWITEEKIVIKGMAIGTKIAVDLGIEMEGIEAAPGRVLNQEAVPKVDTKTEGRIEITPEIGTGPSLSLDPLHV